MSKVTIQDVAARAGVSKGTVSRVLNGHPKVSQQARQAVLDVIAESGYRRNSQAHSLATGRTNAIALTMTKARQELFADPTYAKLIEGVFDAMTDSEYNLVMLLGWNDQENSRAVQYLRGGHVDGLIHLNPYSGDALLSSIANISCPVVVLGPLEEGNYPQRLTRVAADDWGGISSGLTHLAQRGARTIGFISGPEQGTAATRRLAAYTSWQGENFDPSLVELGDYGIDSGREALRRLLQRHPDLDGLACANDRMAIGALSEALDRGLAVPKQLKIVGFDDHDLAAAVTPQLTTIRQPLHELGRLAVSTLFDALAGRETADRVVETTLVPRQTT